ncbi:MAG: hypothetical protein Q4G33_14415 [bacterium]|nr:hypothetical protein [bacterium]
MKTYTVSLFGHRNIANKSEIENRLDKLLHDILTNNDHVRFLIGHDGEFDLLAASAIRRAINSRGTGSASLILVLPYMRSEYYERGSLLLSDYDDIKICRESSKVHFKSAFHVRNRKMVDCSDLVICCIQRSSGGAYTAVQYARNQNCKIINLGNH